MVYLVLVAAACGGTSVIEGGGGGGQGGAGAASSCADLEQAHAAALLEARRCDPSVDEPTCTELVFQDLPCPCQEVFVDVFRTDALSTLAELRQQYQAAGCGPEACPTIACIAPITGSCEPSGTDISMGLCQSQ